MKKFLANGFINNDWDRDNLMFLLTSTEEGLEEWYAQANNEDLEYAGELMRAYRLEMIYRSKEMEVESKLNNSSFQEALEIITKVK